MATNDFKPFSVAGGANVISQADYEALAALSTGFTSGVAKANEINKVLRQASFIAAALAQFVSDKGNVDVLDDGSVSGFVTKLTNAFAAQYLSRSNPFGDIKADGTAALAAAFANLGLGSAAKNNTGDFVSSGGGNYSSIFRMKGVETLPTESAAGNLSSLYSAPSPIPSGVIASGWTANWYLNQIICGIIRGGSSGASGFGIDINGNRVFQVDMGGSAYANGAKLATETLVSGKQPLDSTLTDLSGKTPAQINTYLGLKNAAKRDVGTGSSQIPDMSAFTQGFTGNGSSFSGFFSLPGGLVVQYGKVALYNTSVVSTINLPLSYADGNFAVIATSDLAVSGNVVYPWFGARPHSASQIDLQQSTATDGYACYWVTIGRAS